MLCWMHARASVWPSIADVPPLALLRLVLSRLPRALVDRLPASFTSGAATDFAQSARLLLP